MSAPPEPPRAAASVVDLRSAFDATFAQAAGGVAQEKRRLLAVRVANHPYAIDIDEIAGLLRASKIAPLPGAPPDFLGLAGIRGNLVPTYSLVALLGHGSARDNLPWLVLWRGAELVALAFSHLDGYVELAVSEVHAGENAAAQPHVRRFARLHDGLVGILGISSLVESIKERIRYAGPIKEQR